MDIQLIPVLEITGYDAKIELPPLGPYWSYEDQWAKYHERALQEKGYPDAFSPLVSGTSWYPINSISTNNIKHFIELNFGSDLDLAPDTSKTEIAPVIQGGLAMLVNGDIVLLPQCCSSLEDIESWFEILHSTKFNFYQGHPSPDVSIYKDKVIFDFENHAFTGENFSQEKVYPTVSIYQTDLKKALVKAEQEIDAFRIAIKKLIEVNRWKNNLLDEFIIGKKLSFSE